MATRVSKPTKKKKSSPKKGRTVVVNKIKAKKPTTKPAVQKKPAKNTPKNKLAKTSLTKMPTKKALEKRRQADTDFMTAKTDTVAFLESRRQAIGNMARQYHLDMEELFQEGYEVVLTCLRDFTPVFQKADKSLITVKFTTFFGTRMDGRAMEMRNKNPEYQARAAYTNEMSADEKAEFRKNPPLLVQHLDLETPLQETLRGEASEAQENNAGSVAMKVIRDSFFEKKLNELVAKERDDKKRAVLMHVKVGGVYSFQDVAYHFGVTDSRASQILNDLMDAFYVQRLLDGDLKSVAHDFKKLKFNEKRSVRLVVEALSHADSARAEEIHALFSPVYDNLPVSTMPKACIEAPAVGDEMTTENSSSTTSKTPSYVPSGVHIAPFVDAVTEEENKHMPLLSVELRPVDALIPLDISFRQHADSQSEQPHITAIMDGDAHAYPLLISEKGLVIDGLRRLNAAKTRHMETVMCMVRHVPKELDAKQLRVAVNARADIQDKTELYYAISALLNAGLSQQKIAKVLGISRTNVIVYAKVKDKATPQIRALFEDGLMQITNASNCVDLPPKAQEKLADFVRTYGAGWGKGNQFTTLYSAISEGKLEALTAKMTPQPALSPYRSVAEKMPVHSHSNQEKNEAVAIAHKRLEHYEQALHDSEIWTAQRESVIKRQTTELVDLKSELGALKRELEAAELSKFADPKALEETFKQLRAYYAQTERLSAAQYGITQVNKAIRGLDMTRKQFIELSSLMDDIEKQTNILRVELVNKGRKLNINKPR